MCGETFGVGIVFTLQVFGDGDDAADVAGVVVLPLFGRVGGISQGALLQWEWCYCIDWRGRVGLLLVLFGVAGGRCCCC